MAENSVTETPAGVAPQAAMESPSKPINKKAEGVKIVLYWLDTSRSQRILWLLQALNLPYDIKVYHRNPKTRLAPPELKEIHPLGKSPVISISSPGSDNKPIVIAESGNITDYLTENFGEDSGLVPEKWNPGKEGQVGGETEGWRRYRYYLQYAEGTLMPLMLIRLLVNGIKTAPVPFFIRPITNGVASKIGTAYLDPNTVLNFEFLESQLATSPSTTGEPGSYLCGSTLSAADILMSFPLIAGKGRAGLTKEKYPLLWAYVERLEAEEGYKKAVEKIIELDGSFKAVL